MSGEDTASAELRCAMKQQLNQGNLQGAEALNNSYQQRQNQLLLEEQNRKLDQIETDLFFMKNR